MKEIVQEKSYNMYTGVLYNTCTWTLGCPGSFLVGEQLATYHIILYVKYVNIADQIFDQCTTIHFMQEYIFSKKYISSFFLEIIIKNIRNDEKNINLTIIV